jgi:hypothetical protein
MRIEERKNLKLSSVVGIFGLAEFEKLEFCGAIFGFARVRKVGVLWGDFWFCPSLKSWSLVGRILVFGLARV